MIRYNKKITNLKSKGTFKIILINEFINKLLLLSLIWVFKYEIDFDKYITKFKSRLIAREDFQANKTNIYTATIIIQIFRIFITILAAFDLNVKQLDVKNAYINVFFTKSILYKVPPIPINYEKKRNIL